MFQNEPVSNDKYGYIDSNHAVRMPTFNEDAFLRAAIKSVEVHMPLSDGNTLKWYINPNKTHDEVIDNAISSGNMIIPWFRPKRLYVVKKYKDEIINLNETFMTNTDIEEVEDVNFNYITEDDITIVI